MFDWSTNPTVKFWNRNPLYKLYELVVRQIVYVVRLDWLYHFTSDFYKKFEKWLQPTKVLLYFILLSSILILSLILLYSRDPTYSSTWTDKVIL